MNSIDLNRYYKFGEQYFGPLLYGYVTWLLQQFQKEGITKVYFFSRDGFIMKQAFDSLYSGIEIETYYLEVSRRSLRVPILWKDCSLENILTMISPSIIVSLRSVFDAIGLDIDLYEKTFFKYGLKKDSVFYRNSNSINDILKPLLSDLKEDIVRNSKKEYTFLVSYIKQMNLCGRFAIVDIGWSGGMQRFLQTTLSEMNIRAEIFGYYTGVASYYKRNLSSSSQLNMKGYLFDFCNDVSAKDSRSCFVGLYEMLFLENKGSVMKYQENEGKILAIRYPYEYATSDGMCSEVSNIKQIQKGALDYVKTNSQNNTIHNFEHYAKPLLHIGQHPNNDVIELFADFRFFDEGEYHYLAKPKNLFYYLTHFSAFKKDFLNSRWKTAFLKRLFIIPLPYFAIYSFLKRKASV